MTTLLIGLACTLATYALLEVLYQLNGASLFYRNLTNEVICFVLVGTLSGLLQWWCTALLADEDSFFNGHATIVPFVAGNLAVGSFVIKVFHLDEVRDRLDYSLAALVVLPGWLVWMTG